MWSGQKRCGLDKKKVWSGKKGVVWTKKVWSGQKKCGLNKKGVFWTKKCDLSKIKDIGIRKSELATETHFFKNITMGLYT